jgi:hypothetical protein
LRIFALNFDRSADVQPAGLLLRYDHPLKVHSGFAHKRLFGRLIVSVAS